MTTTDASDQHLSPPAQVSHRTSSPAALITSIAALLTSLVGGYVAIREPNADKVSTASAAISQASQVEHDQLVKVIQAVDDLSKNADQNHGAVETLRTYVDTRLSEVERALYAAPGTRRPAVAAASAAPVVAPLKPVTIPQAPGKPPLWNAQTQLLER